jgi:hypothetical protein
VVVCPLVLTVPVSVALEVLSCVAGPVVALGAGVVVNV